MSRNVFACFLALIWLSPASCAGSYDLVDFERMTSVHRVIIGVPADHWDGDDSARVKHRRSKIMKMVDAHLERASATADSLAIDTIQYAYVTQLEIAFAELFPKHIKAGAEAAGLDEVPGTPAIKLINTETKESMYPDWPILLSEFPAEIDRLVADYERWQAQTTSVEIDSADGVSVLHQTNLAPTAARANGLVAMFYAPWCHYSKLMLPKYAGARALVAQAEASGLLEPGHVVLGKVNVDEEGDLRAVYNISTYPTLKVFNTKVKPAKGDQAGTKRAKSVAPAAPFGAGQASATEVASHALSTLSWAKKGRSFAVLGDPANSKADGVAYDTVDKFCGIARLVDDAFAADAASEPEVKQDESDPSPAEAHRVVTALAVFPDTTPASVRVAATSRVASLVAGGSVFVAACGASHASNVLAKLPGGDEGEGGAEGAGAAVAAAVQAGQLLVSSPGNGGILTYPLHAVMPPAADETPPQDGSGAMGKEKEEDEEAAFEALRKWVVPATWPLVSRFDPSASQGERIRSGGVLNLMVLVGVESDIMFEDYKESLLSVARSHIGEAHFLFADASEPRIAPLLRSSRAAIPGGDSPPVVVYVSMLNAFRPRKREGSDITVESLTAMMQGAKREASADEVEEPLTLKKSKGKGGSTGGKKQPGIGEL